VDFDEGAASALNLARQLATTVDATIHLMHVIPIVLAPSEAAHIMIVREDEVKAALEKMAREQLAGSRHQVHTRTGDVARNIGGAARELNADLIIMPTHGRRGLPRLALGSVAERVIRDAPCPVLTVRPSTTADEKDAVVGMLMIKNPPSVRPTDTLGAAQHLMEDNDLLSIPVVSEGVLRGIITDRDIRSHIGHLEDTRVQSAMAPGPITIAPTMPLQEAGQMLLKLRVVALPVMENGKLVGLLSTSEVIQALLDRGSKE
jgi:nucleotide-binding universal stress UspA family protein